jgi:hypothetical protein
MHYQRLTFRFCRAGDKQLALRIHLAMEGRLYSLLLTLLITLHGYY